jgi:hypothetical protein
MGRTKRGKLLIPSLIAVACAAACGGSSLGGDGQGGADPGGSSVPTGGKYGGSEPTIGSGGSNSIPPDGPTYAGGPAIGVIYGCPPSLPPIGTRCALPTDGPGYCKYSYPANCGQPTIAFCSSSGAWELIAPEIDCGGAAGATNDPTPLTCPSRFPPPGSRCDLPPSLISYQCIYPNGCSQLIETCDERRTWLTTETLNECAGAGGAL